MPETHTHACIFCREEYICGWHHRVTEFKVREGAHCCHECAEWMRAATKRQGCLPARGQAP